MPTISNWKCLKKNKVMGEHMKSTKSYGRRKVRISNGRKRRRKRIWRIKETGEQDRKEEGKEYRDYYRRRR
jgi:hypothetical protein